MTQCIREKLALTSSGSRKIEADFAGGRLTSDGGALLLREADRKLGLTAALDRAISDPRDQRYVTHSQHTLLAQRIFGIALGYEDLNDHDEMRKDPALQVAVGVEEELASAPTLCRLEGRVERDALWQMSETLVKAFIATHTEPPDRLVLDFDATDDPLHGMQEGRFFHGYYDHYCYLPLYVFCGDKLLVAYLRPSGIDPALHSRAILKMLTRRFRREWPGVEIIARGDSDFARHRTMHWCENNEVGYIFGLRRNRVLERKAGPWRELAQEGVEATGQTQRVFGQFRYAAGTWKRDRRVIVKAEHMRRGPNTRFIVTNLKGRGRHLYEETYCRRGEMENRIKEHQLGLFADRTSCHYFVANQFRLLLAAAAYVLIEYVRSEILAGTEMARAQVGTIRLRLLKIGARVVRSTRRIVFHLASGYPLKELLAKVVRRLTTAPQVGPALAVP